MSSARKEDVPPGETGRNLRDPEVSGWDSESVAKGGIDDSPEAFDRDAVQQLLSATVGPGNYELWFGNDCEFDVTADALTVCVPSRFLATRIQNNFSVELRQVVDRLAGPGVAIRFVADTQRNRRDGVPGEEREPAANEGSAETSHPGLRLVGPEIGESTAERSRERMAARRPTLGDFWFGPENRLAEASVHQVLDHPGQISPLVLHGPCGSGKSHLLAAVTHAARRRGRGMRCVHLSAEQFTSLFLQALRGTGLPMFRRKYRDLDLLAIDDVQFFAGKKATLNEFQYTLDNLVREGRQVLVSADRPPAELAGLGPDITARLTSGMVAPLRYAEQAGRLQVARRFCAERRFEVPTATLEFVCERIGGDLRRISGAINRLYLASVVTGGKVTLEVARQYLDDLLQDGRQHASLDQIEEAVCGMCGVQANELRSPSRKKRICTARMLAMYLAREHTGSALSEIGDYFGRSHSTVIAAQRKVDRWLQENESIRLPHADYRASEVVRRIRNDLRIG